MIDSETGSLWSHILGEARQGELEGEQLEVIPSLLTDWKTWRAAHPDTTVMNLSRTSWDYDRQFYSDPERFVIGMVRFEQSRAWSFAGLREEVVVNDTFQDNPIVVVFDVESSGAMIFDRRPNGRTLSFAWREDQLIDIETGTVWHPQTGRALEGELVEERLTPEVGIISFRETWEVFHPKSSYWGEE